MHKVLSVAGKVTWKFAKELVTGVVTVISVAAVVISKKGGRK